MTDEPNPDYVDASFEELQAKIKPDGTLEFSVNTTPPLPPVSGPYFTFIDGKWVQIS
jgi:hypothetical protein